MEVVGYRVVDDGVSRVCGESVLVFVLLSCLREMQEGGRYTVASSSAAT